ncbi:endo alpha-1,4 polygalactosaminidase [Herbiconiux sp. CPCC 205716]|uniref:Endo alpha-1,4 polygalactosaminidase n=1 Tax=Herbiconiux gentiana TaxID=2970912 RepID=A0ABT2GH59_9MICO|nr:endo alpha-1,4 polygalactosaminidase [Herbiconiux gentiana]MCS5715554.1 endo alpha-1,4 polygalactosaminidase [Herbiconiux gentiana]
MPPALRLRVSAIALVAATVLGLSACAGGTGGGGAEQPAADGSTSASPTPTATPSPTPTAVADAGPAAPSIRPLPADPVFDYQLGGAYAPPAGVTVVVRDSTAAPEAGLYNVCYVNGFQSQPGENWPEVLVLRDDEGEPVADPGWPDETIFDITTPDNRAAIADRLAVTVAGCAGSGFDAVEFDNLDSYTRSEGAFGLEQAAQFATMLVDIAHANGLAAGQKNTPELGARGRTQIGFDFAVAEECQRFAECGSYTDVYGGQVLDIEYAGHLSGTWAEVCADPARPVGIILRDRPLAPAGAKGHVYDRC